MKKNLINISLVSSLLIISLTGCNNKSNINEKTESTTEYTSELTKKTTEEKIKIEKTTEEKTESPQNNLSDDQIILNYFEKSYKELEKSIEDANTEIIKQKGKEIFITFVDFIFYDGEIKGIKYSELSDGIKKQLYEDFCDIDALIIKYSPNYKDELTDKYKSVKDFTLPKYYNILEKIKDKLGEDNLDKLNDLKENSSEKVSNIYENTKVKIKQKYEDFKDKNESN